jgi:transcription-repair coupling factor (superfamily II helicase)
VLRVPPEPGVTQLAGLAGCGLSLLVARLLEQQRGPLVCVVADADTLKRTAHDLTYLAPRARLLPLLASESNPYAEAQPDRHTAMQRLSVLATLRSDQPWDVLLFNAAGLVRRVVPRSILDRATSTLRVQGDLDPTELAGMLTRAGYLRVPVVEDPGTFAVRGGLVDIWAAGEAQPVRIDLYGDLIASIKSFDPDTQRTSLELQAVQVAPARETILLDDVCERAEQRLRDLCDEQNYPSLKTRQLVDDLLSGKQCFGAAGYLPAFYDLETIWDYLPDHLLAVVDDPAGVHRAVQTELEHVEVRAASAGGLPHYPVEALYSSEASAAARLLDRRAISCARSFVQGAASKPFDVLELVTAPPVDLAQDDHSRLEREVSEARSTRGKRAVLEPLLERLTEWNESGFDVTAVARTPMQARRLASLLAHRGVQVTGEQSLLVESPSESAGEIAMATVSVDVGGLAHGIIAPLENRVLVTEEEIFGQRAHTSLPRKRRSTRASLEDLRALAPGDFVVHSEHGVGRYLGLENRHLAGAGQVELLVVEYVGGKLFLPVYRLNQIQKYSGGESPKVDRLGGRTFATAKTKARRKAREMADQLLKLYAERNNVIREPLPEADDDYAAFEAAFPYEETTDQAAAIEEVMSDLRSERVMDRLVCGDVGFGKTEVALRAAFRAASVGRQVGVLCPTTVLAQQHYITFFKRLADTPFEVRVLSRFQSKKSIAETLERLKKGKLDIVIGTHRLLSKDVIFKDLGLLVVDEEQRFGVAHKERLKQLRARVDVLTLTATPIPRTLQLAIGGLRPMSIIATPPVNRRAIRTVVARADDVVLKEAVLRELSRGGQVFYVYNRIEGLHERAARLQALLPEARIAVAHGQMRETLLERTMFDFVEGHYDILVTTAIIESGLDIPRANTMLVDRADMFGLAQLYQLRGRIGRSRERAYCYLLVPASSEMSDEARSRIEALERYTELGSGFHIATLDMELRGSGDLLGADQSGPVASVGLTLFCQMLEEATRELSGEPVVHDVDPDLHFDFDALLPDTYVDEVGVRLSLYKRLASAIDEDDVRQVASEMEDRFGGAPPEAIRLVELMRLKVELRRLRVLVCEATRSGVSLRFREDTPLDATRLARLVAAKGVRYRLHPDGRLTRKSEPGEAFADSLALADRMLEELRTVAAGE